MNELSSLCEEALARPGGSQVIEFEGRWFDWGELRTVANGVATLISQSGAPDDAPVTFIPRNRPWAIAALIKLLAQGRTVRMVYAFQSPAAIAKNVAKLNSGIVIAGVEEFSAELEEEMRAAGRVGIALEDLDANLVEGLEKFDHQGKFSPADRPKVEILTSGTTGPPKQFPVEYAMIAGLLAGGTSGNQQAADPASQPPLLLYMPIGNISGIYSTIPTVLRGSRAVLHDRFNLDKWREYLATYKPKIAGLPPAGVQMVIDAGVPKEELAGLMAIGSGAAPLDPTVQSAFEKQYGIPILISYGATEFGGPVTSMSLKDVEEFGTSKMGTVGRPIGGAQLRVIDPETEKELPAGSEGLLEVVSPRIGSDWIRTSDLAVIDEDGFLFHRGRADGAIMRGGFKVLPETIERALILHPAISAAGVVAVKDRRLGEVPGAAIQFKPDQDAPSAQDIETHLREHVMATHIPVHWRFVDALPKTLSFKVDRPALTALFDDVASE
ncbi:class I adenylate-forming enzyme family protein [Pontixanthobacter aquaemixtae]|uniref:AMP-binding protein n=1 Tax=Pontixanthobacter aquaemixtae TaxID=1958940 RepID=A0A844ZQV3_9SPHN|nr:fatty acid--CoA ligase family protein [Pontixanthobacter aquaemixtae]MXO89914.1 AMP-binding protein [Pontixanthobacter aquaemixtae]